MRKVKTKKYRINIMDILVILLAVVCVVSVVLRFVSTKDGYEAKEYRLLFQIDDIKSSSFAFFDGHEGDVVKVKETGEIVGTLGAEFTRGIAIYTYTESEDDKQYYYPPASDNLSFSHERCSISGSIMLSGDNTKDGFRLENGTLLREGEVLEIVTEYIVATIRVVSIEEK